MTTDGEALDRSQTWAVIGAGVHGLSALKALRQLGLAAIGYERSGEVGGNWNFGGPTSRVYESTHTISTKPFTQFPDFPMPASYPDYPSHRQAQAYIKRYASHFGLYDHIRFGCDVTAVEPAGDLVDVTIRDLVTDQETTYRHAGVVIANGHNWNPKMPDYPGLERFQGTIMHSADYKSPAPLRGKRVLVVGAGNTGCDIAVESGQNAERTFHSTRRGYWYNPKYAFGRPSDQVADLLLALKVPLAVRRVLFTITLRLMVGDLTRYGLRKPDHAFFETHPIVNQQLPYYVGHGMITPKPEIERFDDRTVVFTDGSEESIDTVVFATGYLATFPFASEELINIRDGRPQLAQQIFSPSHPKVVVSGLIQPDSGQWTLAHWQGMTIAHYAKALQDRPAEASAFATELMADLGKRFSGGADYTDSTRHFYEVAHQEYLQVLQDDIRTLEGSR